MSYKLYQGDCLEIMDGIKDKSVDLIVTAHLILWTIKAIDVRKKIDLIKLNY